MIDKEKRFGLILKKCTLFDHTTSADGRALRWAVPQTERHRRRDRATGDWPLALIGRAQCPARDSASGTQVWYDSER